MPEPASSFLADKDWRNLLRDIHAGEVLPVVGPELVTVEDPATGAPVPLHRHLAPSLARALNLPEPEKFRSLSAVGSKHMLNGGKRRDIYYELDALLQSLDAPPSPALLDLARIGGLKLFLSTTCDHQLLKALRTVRGDFDPAKHHLAFRPNQSVDLPESPPATLLYHILGHHAACPDFAVWEEDYMEFLCALNDQRDHMRRLFGELQNRFLLLLGAPFTDWTVRFFLRVARQTRLSDRGENAVGECLADRQENLEEPLIIFFDQIVKATRVIYGDPAVFVGELARRWSEAHGQSASNEDFLAKLTAEMPPDAVFLSYAREDREAALTLARGLHNAGIPVWLDKARLQAGQNYETSLEAAVRVHGSFFLSLISETTEADLERKRYFHKERDWAAAQHMDGFVFYLPVSIHAKKPEKWSPQREPACFSKIHHHHLPNGQPNTDFIRYVRGLVEEYRISGRPRG